jgi:hypothetical protein
MNENACKMGMNKRRTMRAEEEKQLIKALCLVGTYQNNGV